MRIWVEEKGTEICDRLSRMWPRTEELGAGRETGSLSDTAGARVEPLISYSPQGEHASVGGGAGKTELGFSTCEACGCTRSTVSAEDAGLGILAYWKVPKAREGQEDG